MGKNWPGEWFCGHGTAAYGKIMKLPGLRRNE